jgi:hypothetical protein
MSHTLKKLFCQTFSENGFKFTKKSAPPSKPQPKLPQPQLQLCQAKRTQTLVFLAPSY